jgi:hypothetical protein
VKFEVAVHEVGSEKYVEFKLMLGKVFHATLKHEALLASFQLPVTTSIANDVFLPTTPVDIYIGTWRTILYSGSP